jgi:hypothetical protein
MPRAKLAYHEVKPAGKEYSMPATATQTPVAPSRPAEATDSRVRCKIMNDQGKPQATDGADRRSRREQAIELAIAYDAKQQLASSRIMLTDYAHRAYRVRFLQRQPGRTLPCYEEVGSIYLKWVHDTDPLGPKPNPTLQIIA